MLNPQASSFSLGESVSQTPDAIAMPKEKTSSGNVRVRVDKELVDPGRGTPISIATGSPFSRTQTTNNQQKLVPHDMPAALPLTSSARLNGPSSERTSPLSMLNMHQKYVADKSKEIRMEQDRHNLMGVASIWAPRPSEKDLHSAYPTPITSSPATPSQRTPSPGLSPIAATFTSRSPPALPRGQTGHPILLAVPQFMQSTSVAPPHKYHDVGPGSCGESSLLLTDSIASQAWFCPMCGNDNRFNTETCAHCDSLNPNRSLIRAISQQQQHAQAFQAYSPSQLATLSTISPQVKNLNSISPMIIMSKLTCHVNAILKVGEEGAKLQDMLVSGDVSLCYAMGMRGLVGKEAINPWKCVGVEIPSQNFIKNVSKPPLGTIAGDWTCSCGRENWAKRSVCSRCFPGIEPEYKSLVFSKVKPILDFITVQEQSGDAQKDAEWLAAEERRMRHEHLKQAQNGGHTGGHTGPVIGKQFVADTRPHRQNSRSPRLQDPYPLQHRPLPDLPSPHLPYSQNFAITQAGPPMTSLGSIYPYPMIQPDPFRRYDPGSEGYTFQPVAPHNSYNQYSFAKAAEMGPGQSAQPASSSRFSVIESSESASESRFSPFSRSGSQQAMPKLGITVTAASSMSSIETAATSSSGTSFVEGEGHDMHMRERAGGLRKVPDGPTLDGQSPSAGPGSANPFSPFSQPQLFAAQALQAKHKSAKKAELRPTRSVSPIGHGRPADASGEDSATRNSNHGRYLSSESVEFQQRVSTEESYVNALGSLLQDVHM